MRLAPRTAMAVLLALIALALALVGRLILAHLSDHPDSPAINVVLAAVPLLVIAALLLNVALATLSHCATATRWTITVLILATAMPYGSLGGGGVLLNVALGLVTAVTLSRAWRSRRTQTTRPPGRDTSEHAT
jgi:hypothetical protein